MATARILIVDSAPAASQALLAEQGGAAHAENYASALRVQAVGTFDELDCFTLSAGDCERLPQGVALTDFAGIVWTGSPFNAYAGGPAVQHQVDLARAAFDSGVPGFGSCWGMQVMSVALGGRVQLHPRGYENGVARQITVSEAGRGHPMLRGRPAVFDAMCWHQDEVCVAPPGAAVLAGNAHSAIQAIAVEDEGRSFWGVQYHPEFDLRQMAALFGRSADRMAADGFVPRAEDAVAMAEEFRALQADPGRRDVAWRYGLGAEVTNVARHGTELGNWLRSKVAGRV